MSLTTPFGTAPAAPQTPNAPPEPDPAPSSRRPLLLVLAVLVAVAVVAGAYLLLFSGGSDVVAAPVVRSARPAASATAAPTAAPTAATTKAPVKARNPFIPLVGESVAATTPVATPVATPAVAAPVATTTPTQPAATVAPATPVPTPSVASVAPVAPVAPTAAPSAPVTSSTVRMGTVSTDNRVAQLTVGTVSKLMQPGQTVDGFTLLNLRDGTCGALQHGTTVFDLCEGLSRTLQ